MKVKKLIEILSNADPEARVILSSDAEGNRLQDLSDWGEGIWYRGELFNDEAELHEYTNQDITLYQKAVVLWPRD